jgi:hypothetical protein
LVSILRWHKKRFLHTNGRNAAFVATTITYASVGPKAGKPLVNAKLEQKLLLLEHRHLLQYFHLLFTTSVIVVIVVGPKSTEKVAFLNSSIFSPRQESFCCLEMCWNLNCLLEISPIPIVKTVFGFSLLDCFDLMPCCHRDLLQYHNCIRCLQ